MKRAVRATINLTKGPIARASITSVAIRLCGLALLFLQAMLTGRLLGAEGYGTVAVAMSIAQIAATIAMLGFGPLAVREIPRRLAIGDPAGAAGFTRFAMLATLVFSCVLAAGIMVSDSFIAPHYRTVVSLGAFLVPPLALIVLLRGIAQGHGNVAGAQVPGEVLRPAIMVCGFGGAALLGLGATDRTYMHAALAASTIAALTGAAIVWFIYSKHTTGPSPVHARRQWTADALPFLGLGLVSMLQGEINTLLLGWLAGPKEAGLFQPVLRLMPIVFIAPQAISMRFDAKVSELWTKGEKAQVVALSRKFTYTTTAVTALVALAMALASPWLMLIFGPEFESSAPLLWLTAGVQIFDMACGPVAPLLSMSGNSRLTLQSVTLALVVNAVTGLILIPQLSALGAVISMICAMFTWNCLSLLFVIRHLGINPSLLARAIDRNE